MFIDVASTQRPLCLSRLARLHHPSVVPLHAPAAKAGLIRLQRPRPLEMSVHGLAPDGHWQLFGFREPRSSRRFRRSRLGWIILKHRGIPLLHECADYG
jgi:hypothetical protein